jgi:hypothetical protein
MAKCKGGNCSNPKHMAKAAPGPVFADSPQFQQPPKRHWLKGAKPGLQNINTKTQAQNEILNNTMNTGNNWLQNPQSSPIFKQTMDLFNNNIVPSLAHRFSGMGGRRSSGFHAGIAGAGQQLAQQLPGRIQQNALPLIQEGTQNRYQTVQHGAKAGLLHGLASPVGRQLFGGLLGYIPSEAGGGGGMTWSELAQIVGIATGMAGLGGGGGAGGGGGGGGGYGDVMRMMGGGSSSGGRTIGGSLGGGGGGGGGGNSPLNEEALQQLIQALVGNQDIKQTLMAGG